MNLLSLVGPRLDNICQIRRKWYYSLGCKNLQSEEGLISEYAVKHAVQQLTPLFTG
jgi:hypothetical protein